LAMTLLMDNVYNIVHVVHATVYTVPVAFLIFS